MTGRGYPLVGATSGGATSIPTADAFRNARILVVDDQAVNLRFAAAVLTSAGYTNFETIEDPREVVDTVARGGADLILLDLHMPRLDGYAVMEALDAIVSPDSYVPVVVLTADTSPEARERALALGAKDFLTKPLDPTEMTLRIANLLETRTLHLRLRAHNARLEDTVIRRTTALSRALGRVESMREELRLSQDETVKRLSMAAELRDPATGEHIERMSKYCLLLSERLGLAPARCETIRVASQMHDVGKIAIADSILLKPSALEPGERLAMQEHAEIGRRVLAGSHSELMQTAATIAWTHHERVDGRGYPRGLSGGMIPVEGRIAAIADVFDALTSDRVYRRAMTLDQALEIIKEGRGHHFDAHLLDEFLTLMPKLITIREEHGHDLAAC